MLPLCLVFLGTFHLSLLCTDLPLKRKENLPVSCFKANSYKSQATHGKLHYPPSAIYHGLTAASQDVSLSPVCITDCRPRASFHRNMDDPIMGHIRQNPSEPLKRSLSAQASQQWPHTCSGQWSMCPVFYFNQWPWQNDLESMQESCQKQLLAQLAPKKIFFLSFFARSWFMKQCVQISFCTLSTLRLVWVNESLHDFSFLSAATLSSTQQFHTFGLTPGSDPSACFRRTR